MDHERLSWDLQRSFLGALRSGSLSAAARALGLTQPTLGRHIDALETELGVKLFTRSRHGLLPTRAALDLVPHAEAMEAAARSFVRTASGESSEPRGSVRVTASNIIGVEVLPAILTEFRERNPRIAIELALSNRNQDLSRRDADIAIRMVRPTQKALIAKRLGTVHVGLYAHRDYLARHGVPRDLADLSRHAVIGFDHDESAFRWLGVDTAIMRDSFALRTDDDLAQLNALRAGFGIGGCQVGIALREPSLIPVLPQSLGFRLEMWLVMHEDLRGSRRTRVLLEFLAVALRAYARSGKQR